MANPTLLPPSPPASAATPDPLAGLRDWHLPDPVSWWPPAPGWWLLAGVVLVALVGAVLLWRGWRRQGAAGRAALRELATLRAQLPAGLDRRNFAAALSVLLRRLALTRFPRERVAGLSGAAWLAFLDATGGGGAFARGPGLVLAELPYQAPGRDPGRPGTRHEAGPHAAWDAQALADLAERWIRTNRRAAR